MTESWGRDEGFACICFRPGVKCTRCDPNCCCCCCSLSLSLCQWAEQCARLGCVENLKREKTGTENKCWLAPFACLHEKGICWICHGYILLSPAARTAPRKTHLRHLFLRASPCFLPWPHPHRITGVGQSGSQCLHEQCSVLCHLTPS
jgi:hypothetical protein